MGPEPGVQGPVGDRELLPLGVQFSPFRVGVAGLIESRVDQRGPQVVLAETLVQEHEHTDDLVDGLRPDLVGEVEHLDERARRRPHGGIFLARDFQDGQVQRRPVLLGGFNVGDRDIELELGHGVHLSTEGVHPARSQRRYDGQPSVR